MGFFFTIFYQPIANILFGLMQIIDVTSLALGILLLILLTKILLLPIAIKNTRFQVRVKTITEDLKKIRENTKDRKIQAEKTLDLYKKAGVNPFTPLLFLIIQIPIFISIFFVLRDVGNGTFSTIETLYTIVAQPVIDFHFLLFNLMDQGIFILALLVGITQTILMYFSQKNITNATVSKTQQIVFIVVFPVLAAGVSFFFVAAVGIYWLFNNLISILQEIVVLHVVRLKEETLKT